MIKDSSNIDYKTIQTTSLFIFFLAYISLAAFGAYHNKYKKHLALCCHVILRLSACSFFAVGIKDNIETFSNLNNNKPNLSSPTKTRAPAYIQELSDKLPNSTSSFAAIATIITHEEPS